MTLTLRRAVVLAILAGLLVPGIFISYLTLQRQEDSLIKRLSEDHNRITEILVLGMQEPLWNLSPDTGKPLLESVMSDERIVRVIVQDATLGTFLEKNSPERRQGKLKTLSQNVTKQGNDIGKVTVEMDDGTALASIHQYQRYYFVTAAIQLIASLAFILVILQKRVLNPLQRLMSESIRLARRDLSTPFEWKRQDEIGKLGQSLEITRQSLHSLFGELESKNKELEADILQRKQIEHALRASEDRYRRLVESTNVVPWEANPAEWRFTYIGPQAETLLGYPLHIWYSEGFLTSYLHQDDRHLAYKLFTETQDKDNTIEFECRMLGSDGKSVWVMLVATAIPDEAGERHLQGYLIDISARKSTEIELNHYRNHLEELVEQRTKALAAANKELEAFSYSVSHDLRAPLRSVDGFSQVLLEDYADKLDDAGRQYLGRIRRATQNMSNLIDDLLNLSKLTRSEVNTQPVNLSEIATEITQDLKLAEPSREVSINIMPNLITDADPKLVRVALQNLLANAWKFTAKTLNGEIKFGATHIDGQNAFYVSDNGAGFDMAYADKLFGAFQRLHSPQEFEGNGVGLAIVQRIVNRHNGRVWAKGALNQGATFYFTLPRQADRAAGVAT
ncbi:ATP-binding protein [Chitinimonas viridis]|uniref:histidine kinase n=1 Tax=Chitinimonas viridis TaxID=664880 RepID=A0ABT8B3W9_9NEIS|nr:ATP-binding protein [Chitinimonas viridis]MDN3576952.1 ATP-binding protein [Chitinimonas viridis]